MRVGILIDRLNVGGVEKIAIEEVKALRALGEDAHLVVLRQKAVVSDAFSDLLGDVPIIYLDQRLHRFLRFSFSFPMFHFFSLFHITYPLFLPLVVKRKEFDYLIVHGTYTCLSAITLKRRRSIPFSAFIWDPASYILDRVYKDKLPSVAFKPLKHIATSLDRFLINNMGCVLVGGTAHNAFIHSLSPQTPIKIVYPSVHPAHHLLHKEDYALVVTAWKRGKNPEYLLDIARELPTIHIKMVGKWVDPSYKEEFEGVVRANSLTAQIDVVGEVSEIELSRLYGCARVLLQTNDDRGFGMPAIEAAGQGTTFIIPEGQGVCELFVDGKDGYYTREKDTHRIVSLLEPLIKDKARCIEMGSRAWKKVKHSYSWERHAAALRDMIIDQENESQATTIPH